MQKYFEDISVRPVLLTGILFLYLSGFGQNINSLDQLFKNNTTNTGSFYFYYSQGEDVLFDKNYSGGNRLIQSNTVIKISSASESLVAATIMTFVDEGRLKLEDQVSDFLPQFKGEMRTITIRQLLSHTSGLPSNSIYLQDDELTLKYSVNNIAENLSLNTSPGTEFSYGAVDYQVLGRIAEVITDKSWSEILREKIAGPCKMINTSYKNNKGINVARDILSSAADFENFLSMVLNKGLFNGKRILSEASVNEMIKDQTSQFPVGYAPYRYQGNTFSGYYGLGFWIDRLKENGAVTEISAQGAKGFTGWVNFCTKGIGIFSVYGDLKYIQPVITASRNFLNNKFAENCNDLSAVELARKNEKVRGSTYTNISFELYSQAEVNLKLFDPLGNQLEELIDGQLKKGSYNFPVDISELSSGVYFYRLRINDKVETKKLTIRK